MDTEHSAPSHQMNTRHNPGVSYYQTSILDGTHFQESLNATVELHKSVNYFDTHQLERSQANDGMRKRSLAILNEVSQAIIDPLQGMIKFLNALKLTFQRAETVYFQNPEMPLSPIYSRQQIFDCQKKGSFDSNWHEDSNGMGTMLNQDYVNMMLKLTQQEIKSLEKQAGETDAQYLIRFRSDSKEIYEQAYAVIKTEMGLRADLAPTILDKKKRELAYVSQQTFFSKAASNDEETDSKPSHRSESSLNR